jgi:hypothetical protein
MSLPDGLAGEAIVGAAARQSIDDLHNNRRVSKFFCVPAGAAARNLTTKSGCDITADAWRSIFPNADGLRLKPSEPIRYEPEDDRDEQVLDVPVLVKELFGRIQTTG